MRERRKEDLSNYNLSRWFIYDYEFPCYSLMVFIKYYNITTGKKVWTYLIGLLTCLEWH